MGATHEVLSHLYDTVEKSYLDPSASNTTCSLELAHFASPLPHCAQCLRGATPARQRRAVFILMDGFSSACVLDGISFYRVLGCRQVVVFRTMQCHFLLPGIWMIQLSLPSPYGKVLHAAI